MHSKFFASIGCILLAGSQQVDRRQVTRTPSLNRCFVALEQANEEGYRLGDAGALQSTYLQKGQSAQESFLLRRGTPYRIIAVAGEKDAEIEVRLLAASGNGAAKGGKPGNVGRLDFTPSNDGRYLVRLEALTVGGGELSDVSLLCVERTSFTNRRPGEAARWRKAEEARIEQAASTARDLLPALTSAPVSVPGKPVPWFFQVSLLRSKETLRRERQTYANMVRVALAGESGSSLAATPLDERNEPIAASARTGNFLDLQIPASPSPTGFEVKNLSGRTTYVAAYWTDDPGG